MERAGAIEGMVGFRPEVMFRFVPFEFLGYGAPIHPDRRRLLFVTDGHEIRRGLPSAASYGLVGYRLAGSSDHFAGESVAVTSQAQSVGL